MWSVDLDFDIEIVCSDSICFFFFFSCEQQKIFETLHNCPNYKSGRINYTLANYMRLALRIIFLGGMASSGDA